MKTGAHAARSKATCCVPSGAGTADADIMSTSGVIEDSRWMAMIANWKMMRLRTMDESSEGLRYSDFGVTAGGISEGTDDSAE